MPKLNQKLIFSGVGGDDGNKASKPSSSEIQTESFFFHRSRVCCLGSFPMEWCKIFRGTSRRMSHHITGTARGTQKLSLDC